jgi:hypothetical protein
MSMSGYTKLFHSILVSTIWLADDQTRIVWITMLAMADRHGVVEGSVPGLASFARVPVAACRRALTELASPDKDSRSQDHDGRRITAIDGGWQIVNHDKYRQRMGADERREYLRQKQAEYRRRIRQSPTVSDTSILLTHTEAEADTEAVRTAFDHFWAAYPRKVGKDAALRVWTRLGPGNDLLTAILGALEWQRAGWTEPQFIPHPRTWLHQGRWKDEQSAPVKVQVQEAWRCPHVTRCPHRQACEIARMSPAKHPVREAS